MSEPKWRRYERFAHPDVKADVDDEMEFHIQIIAERFVKAGYGEEEARTMARQEFGDRDRARNECIEIDTTRMRHVDASERISRLWQDVRHGARRLLKSPVFAIVSILTLAIGIGPNIAIFSIINSVLLEPLPFAKPNELVYIQETFPVPGGKTGNGSVSYPNYLDWKAQSKSFDLAISSFSGSTNFQGAGDPERLSAAAVSADAFNMLGVRPLLGRSFATGEDAPEAPKLAVLGETFWRRRFNADPSIIGKPILLDGTPNTVVGIMPAAATFPSRSAPIDVWVPLQVQLRPNSRGRHSYVVIGRLRNGVGLAAATTEMKQIAARLAELYPGSQEKRSVALTPYRDVVVGNVRAQLLVLLGAAGLVLLIACANAASLLLARASSRAREVAVLAALGASRARVAQQFLVESLILATCGALAGFLMSRVAVKAIIAAAGTTLPRSTQIHFDLRVVGFIVATIVTTAVLFGLVPALQATKSNLQDCLRAGGRSASAGRGGLFRSSLVVGQFALSLVLLAGAGLLFRTFASLIGTPTGMSTEHVLTMRIPFPYGSPKYPTADEALNRFYDPLLERLRALPEVQSAGMINLLPLQQTGSNGNFSISGKSYASVSEQPFAEYRVVSPGYFTALKIPVLRGRDASAADRSATQQVVLVNEQFAKRYFAGEDPIGKALEFGTVTPTNPASVIVGVVGSVRQASLTAEAAPEIYFPTGQAGGQLANMTLVVRASGDPMNLSRSVQNLIRSIDPAQPVYRIETMENVVRGSVANSRLYLGLLATFAGVALSLAIAGIYGVMAYGVSQRTREFGIRMALGSDTHRVQRLVVWQGAKLALLGVVVGLPSAYLATKLLAGVLYGVAPGDPTTLFAVAGILATVSVVASYLPSRRVTSVDPIIAMRAE